MTDKRSNENDVGNNLNSTKSRYVRLELDRLLKLLRLAQEWLQLFSRAGLLEFKLI